MSDKSPAHRDASTSAGPGVIVEFPLEERPDMMDGLLSDHDIANKSPVDAYTGPGVPVDVTLKHVGSR